MYLIEWTSHHQNVLKVSNHKMESPEVITIPDLNKPFVVHCGASWLGLGRALYQQEDRKLKGISYTS